MEKEWLVNPIGMHGPETQACNPSTSYPPILSPHKHVLDVSLGAKATTSPHVLHLRSFIETLERG